MAFLAFKSSLCNPKVTYFDPTISSYHNVRWFDVLVQDPLALQVHQALAEVLVGVPDKALLMMGIARWVPVSGLGTKNTLQTTP